MFYFYFLRFARNGKFYYGYTSDLKRRIQEHKNKKSSFTSKNGKFDLVFYEAYKDKRDARSAESYFKSGHGREVFKEKIRYYLGSLQKEK